MPSGFSAWCEALDLDRELQRLVSEIESPLADRVESVLAYPSGEVAIAQLQLEEILGRAA